MRVKGRVLTAASRKKTRCGHSFRFTRRQIRVTLGAHRRPGTTASGFICLLPSTHKPQRAGLGRRR